MPKRLRGPSPAHNHAPVQEAKIAKRIGGAVTRGSGNGYVKGDARRPGLVRVESKCTSRKSFSVTREMIEKLEAAVFGADEIPVFDIQMLDEQGKPAHKLLMVPDWAMSFVLEGWEIQKSKTDRHFSRGDGSTIEERFWAKVDKTPGLGPDGDCWEWTAAIRPNGYGLMGAGAGVVDGAHRIGYMIQVGDIPDNRDVCHTCDNRRCVRGDHLFVGTRKENMEDASRKGRLKRNAAS